MPKVRSRDSIRKLYQKDNHDWYTRLALGVEYYLAKQKEKDPDARFLWEKESWIIQYLPLLLSYRTQLSFLRWVNTHKVLSQWGGLYFTKYDVYKFLPERFVPETILIPKEKDLEFVQKQRAKSTFGYPCIAKPDGGTRAMGVEILRSDTDLKRYHKTHSTQDYLLQEFVDFPHEFGVLCMWDTEQKRFGITSLAQKKFFSVTGDGRKNLRTLIEELEDLSEEQKQNIIQAFPESELTQVLREGTSKSLARFASIRYGTMFETLSPSRSDFQKLETLFHEILQDFRGFYAGRFDIKASSLQDIINGRFKILELNPVTSVPQHIEDEDLPVWDKYQEMRKHMNALEKIAQQNRPPQRKEQKHSFLKDCVFFFWRSRNFESAKKSWKSLIKGFAVIGGVVSIVWVALVYGRNSRKKTVL